MILDICTRHTHSYAHDLIHIDETTLFAIIPNKLKILKCRKNVYFNVKFSLSIPNVQFMYDTIGYFLMRYNKLINLRLIYIE